MMNSEIRKLTEQGCAEFRQYLYDLGSYPKSAPPFDLLTDGVASVDAGVPGSVEHAPLGRPFRNRHEFGLYLAEVLGSVERAAISLDYKLWNWLALYYFDQICPPNAAGERKLFSDISVYLLDVQFRWQRYYRHFIRAPWLAACLHPDTSRAILIPREGRSAPLATRGELFEQIASRQSLLRSPAVMKTVNVLYFDAEQAQQRAGSGGSAAGSPRRFGAVMNQLGLTYDLEWDHPDVIMSILPAEFNKWKPPASATAAD